MGDSDIFPWVCPETRQEFRPSVDFRTVRHSIVRLGKSSISSEVLNEIRKNHR